MDHKKILKIFIFTLICVFYTSFLVHKIDMPAADDLPRQIKIGEEVVKGNWNVLYENVFSYTEPKFNFYNHHWFSGVIFYVLDQTIGWNGLVIFKTIILLITFSLLFGVSTKKADFWLVALVSIPVILILRERTGLRPEVFSYLFIAIYLYLFSYFEDNPKTKKIYLLIPLQILWVNMHVFFSIGVMLVGGFLFEKVVQNWREIKSNKIIRKLGIVFVLVVLVSFINPRGVGGVFYKYPSIPLKISENQTLFQYQEYSAPYEDISVTLFTPTVMALTVSIFVFLFYYFKQKNTLKDVKYKSVKEEVVSFPVFYLLGAVATSVLGFFILRGIAMFAMILLIALPLILNLPFLKLKNWLKSESERIAKLLGIFSVSFIVLILAWLIYLSFSDYFGGYIKGVGLAPMSMGGINFYKENNLKGPIFNDSDIGSYLIYNLYPEEKVFSDNRFGDAYSYYFWDEIYIPTFEYDEVWQESLKRYNYNVIFLYHYNNGNGFRNFLYNRLQDPEWAFVYGDAFTLIFVRNIPENKEVIDKYQITSKNADEKLQYLLQINTLKSVVARADIFNLLNRLDLSRETFLDVVSRKPDYGKIWMVMGQWELSIDSPDHSYLGMMYFQKAIDVGHRTAEAYSFLGLSFYRVGRLDDAVKALNKALELNPERQDALSLMQIINEQR